jgi:hypothetical protein
LRFLCDLCVNLLKTVQEDRITNPLIKKLEHRVITNSNKQIVPFCLMFNYSICD